MDPNGWEDNLRNFQKVFSSTEAFSGADSRDASLICSAATVSLSQSCISYLTLILCTRALFLAPSAPLSVLVADCHLPVRDKKRYFQNENWAVPGDFWWSAFLMQAASAPFIKSFPQVLMATSTLFNLKSSERFPKDLLLINLLVTQGGSFPSLWTKMFKIKLDLRLFNWIRHIKTRTCFSKEWRPLKQVKRCCLTGIKGNITVAKSFPSLLIILNRWSPESLNCWCQWIAPYSNDEGRVISKCITHPLVKSGLLVFFTGKWQGVCTGLCPQGKLLHSCQAA